MPLNNPPVFDPLSFTELVGGEAIVPALDNTWEDWDLAAIIPPNSVSVLIGCYNDSAGSQTCGIKKKGSALARTFACAAEDVYTFCICECDASRIIEIYGRAAGAHNTAFNVLGYWN